ncbi:cell division protein FtsZ [Mariniphaga sediminis]|jgi:cell division protein FtsZ|uniref:Cell division protein FtsZ n=1 Tax=Mariniphaga sediminis TaxID=1628158 RepID=A0A399D592_9BACT|nr:cell division protein FtsZ [Mariniphaga sediminis]RIH66593.1 cell division protein FtsZ [Mariniphaga sediminis]
MTELVNFQFPKASSSIIKVIGVGGGGCNAVSHMFEEGITGVDFIICNTDAQAMENSPVPVKIQLGVTLTEGRGAGNLPQMGEEAARENYEDIKNVLQENTKMLFITAGMGGGTGTGAAPVIAGLARELGILTIAVVTVPSPAEGKKRFGQAMEGIKKLGGFVDSMLVVSNQRLHSIFGDLPARKAFKMADNIVATAVKGVAEIITLHGNVNIDFTDVYTVMHDSHVFIMGTGLSSGEGRSIKAVNEALESPLLDSNDIYGTKNILLNIISGKDEITIGEIGEIIETLQERAGQEADIIWGNGYDENLGENVSVTILATGFKTNPNQLLQPKEEPEKFNLEEEKENETALLEESVDSKEMEPAEMVFEMEMEGNGRKIVAGSVGSKSGKGDREEIPVSKKRKVRKKRAKADEPVNQGSIDSWFYKNFRLGRLFEDDDQPLEG